jgi:hypothetical protein
MTYQEQERAAYIAGDTRTAALLARAADADDANTRENDIAAYIQEARGCFPAEDCLQDLIDQCRAMTRARVTKADLLEFLAKLENTQSELASAGEYGADELRKALR